MPRAISLSEPKLPSSDQPPLDQPPLEQPLSHAQLAAVGAAKERASKIQRAAGVAKFNGWMIGIFAVLSLPFAFFSLPGFLIAVALAVVAYNEFKGGQRLLKFDRTAPAFLGWNQVGFLAAIVLYCLWMLANGLTGEGPFAAEMKANPELQSVFDSPAELDQLYRLLVLAVYVSVIVVSILFQGLNAVYYFTRRKYVEAYLQETPEWVLNLQRLNSV